CGPEHRPAVGARPLEGGQGVLGRAAGGQVRVVVRRQAAQGERVGPMLKSLKLHGIGPVKDLSASFGDRLNVVTGDNVLGKSFLLDIACWSLTGSGPGGRVALPEPQAKKESPTIAYHLAGKKGATKAPKTATYDPHTQAWVRPAGRPTTPGLVLYAAVD